MSVQVKICGLTTPETVDVCVESGADMVGFVFFEKSPRNISTESAHHLMTRVPHHVKRVGLLVNPDDDMVRQVAALPLDILQLHKVTAPGRVSHIRDISKKEVYVACGIARASDLEEAAPLVGVADGVFFDAKPPTAHDLPGGRGVAFDWSLLNTYRARCPWLLAGGLTPDNVQEAISATNAPGVDVSSGVESQPGQKDVGKIRDFIARAKSAV